VTFHLHNNPINNETHYQYLLRLQHGRDQAHWRAMVRDAATGDERHFATERELVRFLLTTLHTPQSILAYRPNATNCRPHQLFVNFTPSLAILAAST
jgi:hypothetical protein